IKADHVAECFKRIGGIFPEFEPIIGSDSDCRYRNKAQYPVAIENGEIRTGFYAPHSHRVIHCPDCLLQPEEFRDILAVFSEYIKMYNISVYDETKNRGLLRHIYIRKGTASGEIMVCAVINGKKLPAEDVLVKMLTEKENAIKSIIINSNTKDTNVILGDKCRTLWGEDCITDILCGLKFRISPLSFYQVNRDMAERLYNKAAEYAECNGKTVLDLYCGAGTIGLSLANKAKKIIGVEIVPEAIEDAKINAQNNNIENAEFICMDASAAARELAKRGLKPDVVIVDPPRKGCTTELLNTIANDFTPERLVYVSCDSATLARDCAILKSLGYILTEYTPVDMFPATAHIETVAKFIKA
ncbi:MAG: 23S rRNA (uracil(1939)-C(5))-methyltransferase RlmD, partial [Clostridia bacterium]|nr:23S rRNA (uracil(1939)-C(5))-methyltransferase RlmD [Clostridia bacterium]